MRNKCSIPGCDNFVVGRGWCSLHWGRWRKHGDPLHERKRRAVCSIPDCERISTARGWCRLHYERWYEQGDPLKVKVLVGASVEWRFWSKVDFTGPVPAHRPDLGECWLWTGGRQRTGYGRFGIGQSYKVLAYRFAYEFCVGVVPAGLTLDHLCRIRLCVNPWHLEPVTHLENVRRGSEFRRAHRLLIPQPEMNIVA